MEIPDSIAQKDLKEANDRIEECARLHSVRLDIDQLQLRELPESIGRLTHLTSVSCTRSSLNSLPPGLRALQNLEHLQIGVGGRFQLPEWISSFHRLQVLNVIGHGEGQALEFLPRMDHLRTLGLQNLMLRTITSRN
jgi:Leucine-rich repeat (LRR) protein